MDSSNFIFCVNDCEFVGAVDEVMFYMKTREASLPFPVPPVSRNPDNITVYRIKRDFRANEASVEPARVFELCPASGVGYYVIHDGNIFWKELDRVFIERDPSEVRDVAFAIMNANRDQRLCVHSSVRFDPFKRYQQFGTNRYCQAVCSQCCQIKLLASPVDYVARTEWRIAFACDDCRKRIAAWVRGPGAPWNLMNHNDVWKYIASKNIWVSSLGFIFKGIPSDIHDWHEHSRPDTLLGEIGNNGYIMIPNNGAQFPFVCAQRIVYEAFNNLAFGSSPKRRFELRSGGKRKKISIVIAHIDDNKCNNAFENISCITQTENVRMAINSGRLGAPHGRHPGRGSIVEIAFIGNAVKRYTYGSAYKAEKEVKVRRNDILNLCKGRYIIRKHQIIEFDRMLIRAVWTKHGLSTFVFA